MVEIYDQQLTQIKEVGKHEREKDLKGENPDELNAGTKNLTPDEIIQENRKLLKNNEDQDGDGVDELLNKQI